MNGLSPATAPQASSTMDSQAFKLAARHQWDRAAPGWNGHAAQIRAWLALATEAMLEMAGVQANARVLDVAAGAGDQTLDIAARVGPQGFVLATDLSPAILALALQNAQQAGHHQVHTRVADGESLPFEAPDSAAAGCAPANFDAAVCRLGLMLFPDPLKGLREMRRALRPGGRACTMVFSRPDRNPCITILMSTALRLAGLPPRDPFQAGGLLSLGQPGRMDALFAEAGFQDVATTVIDAPFALPSARHYVQFVQASASPIQQILGGLDATAAAQAWAEIEDRLSAFNTRDGWEGPNQLLLTAGRR
jgi:SAM-dependent methyltransferase